MSTVQRIARNTSVLLVAQISNYLLSFVYMVSIARHLGAAGFGILSFAMAFTLIFSVFADLGLQPLTTREVARDKSLASKYMANVSLMKIILVIITFGIIALTINLMGYPQQTINVVYLMALHVIMVSFTEMFYSVFRAFERMEYESLGRILNSSLILCLVIVAIKCEFSVTGFASLFPLAAIVVLLYSFATLRWKISRPVVRWPSRKLEMDLGFWKLAIKEALPFGLGLAFVTIFYWVDSIMLSVTKGDAVVGWYNAAYRIVLALIFIPSAFSTAIFPVISRYYLTSREALNLSLEKFFKCMVILGIPIGIGITLLAQRSVLLIFGAEYSSSILALQILVWSSVFIFITRPFGILLWSSNRQSVVTKISGICVIINVVLNLVLIPKYSLIGAGIATVITEFISLTLILIYSFKIGYGIPKKKFASIILRVLIASVPMGVLVACIENFNLLAIVVLSAILYFVVLFIIRGIDKEDIYLIRKVVRRK